MKKIFYLLCALAESLGFSQWWAADKIGLIEYSDNFCNTSVTRELQQLTCGKFEICEIIECSVFYNYEFVIFDSVEVVVDKEVIYYFIKEESLVGNFRKRFT